MKMWGWGRWWWLLPAWSLEVKLPLCGFMPQYVLSTSAINSPCFCQVADGKEHRSLGLEEAVYGGAELMGWVWGLWGDPALWGQCHGAGKMFSFQQEPMWPGNTWFCLHTNGPWLKRRCFSIEAASGEAGGVAHSLPRTLFSWVPLLGGESIDQLERFLQTFSSPFIRQMCLIHLLDQSVFLQVIHSGNKIQWDSGRTFKPPQSSPNVNLSTQDFFLFIFYCARLLPSTKVQLKKRKQQTLLIGHDTLP